MTGGRYHAKNVASTELLDYSAPAGGWREAGQLPTPREGLRAAKLGHLILVLGGHDDGYMLDGQDYGYMDTVLSWSPGTESWQEVGNLVKQRNRHGVAEVSLAAIEDYCQVL